MLGLVSTKGAPQRAPGHAWWKVGGKLTEQSVVSRSGPACAQATASLIDIL
jgi:hypothetical protein